MKIRWKKVFYYFLAFDFLFAIKSCNLPTENEPKKSENTTKESQDSLTLTGLVTKNDSITPIPFCDVTLFDIDSIVIAKTTADFNGCYSFSNILPKNYILGFSGIGFQTNFIEIKIQSDTNIKISLQLKENKKPQLIIYTSCYMTLDYADSVLVDDFFNDINIKQDTFSDEKESDLNDSLIEKK